MKTCFFIGHRETSERVLPALTQEVERHITEYGVTEFVVGHYGGFDRLGIQGFTGALPESRRLAEIVGLAGSGYADKLILSHDSIIRMLGDPWVYSEQDARDLAHWNWIHVFEDILPRLQEMGLRPEQAEAMVTANPQRLFGA